MKPLLIENNLSSNVTIIKNSFLDNYMPSATGDAVKIYLLLLRNLNEPTGTLTVSHISSMLSISSEATVECLNYWEKVRLLTLSRDSSGRICGIRFESPSNISPENITTENNHNFISSSTDNERKDFSQLIFICETYLQRPLRHVDIDFLKMLHNDKGLSLELIEYLVEYCVENNHDSIHYIKKVGLSWADEGIKTPKEAKNYIDSRKLIYKKVFSAFGLSGRAPSPTEKNTIDSWKKNYAFSDDVIIKAVERTIENTHEASFPYTETILKSWKDLGLETLEDIEIYDMAYKKGRKNSAKSKNKSNVKQQKNSFTSYDQRDYDYDALQKKLLNLD